MKVTQEETQQSWGGNHTQCGSCQPRSNKQLTPAPRKLYTEYSTDSKVLFTF